MTADPMNPAPPVMRIFIKETVTSYLIDALSKAYAANRAPIANRETGSHVFIAQTQISLIEKLSSPNKLNNHPYIFI
jgi:hypothetical protein